MTSRDCPLKFSKPTEGAVQVLGLSFSWSEAPGSDLVSSLPDPTESSAVVTHPPLSCGVMEVTVDADRRSPSAASASLPTSPVTSVLAVTTALHSPALPDCPTRSSVGCVGEERPALEVYGLVETPFASLQCYDSPEAIYARYIAARSVW